MTKWVICFDTICTGFQPVTDGTTSPEWPNGVPVRYKTRAAAQAEIDSDPEFYQDDSFVCKESEIGHKTIFTGGSESRAKI